MTARRTCLLACLLGLGVTVPVGAQSVFEAAGERALGMAGAFVAVADDATAVHWNPAGLVGGQPLGMTIGWHQFQVGNPDLAAEGGARRGRSTLTSLGTWPLGVSYGTTQRSGLATSAAGLVTGQSLRVSHVGVTILQSLIEDVVVGSTLRMMRGGLATTDVESATSGEALERVADMSHDAQTTFDLDLGLMARAPRLRVGLALKNLRSPEFRDVAGNAISLPRQSRVGLAVLPTDGVTLAIDLDLNTVDLMGDLRRMFAVGGEVAVGSRLQVRSGVRWNVAADWRAVGAVGASVSLRRGFWVDGHYSLGRDDESRELGVALRAGF